MTQEDDCKLLLRHFISVIRSMKGQPADNRMILAEGMAMKLFGHVSSLVSLYGGTKLQIDNSEVLEFVDNGSINILVRAAFETSLAFHFIFCESSDSDERDFRFMCWDYAGFKERQGFRVMSDAGRELKANESKMLEEVKTKIQGHRCFGLFTSKQQRRILEGEWRLGRSWTTIAVNAGYSEGYFKSTYSYLCGYSHTGRLSVLQIAQATARNDQKRLAEACVGYSCVVIANFLFGYASLFPKAAEALQSNLLAFHTAQIWIEISQAMD